MVPVVSHPTGGRTRAALSATLVTALVGSGLVLAPAAATAAPERPATVTFETTQLGYTIPSGVVAVRATLTGGLGAAGATEAADYVSFLWAGSGGLGRELSGPLSVAAGDTVDIYVGANAAGSTGGSGYTHGGDGGIPTSTGPAVGGGGGGSSAIVVDGTPIVIAAGGGGGGGAYGGPIDGENAVYQAFAGDGGAADLAGSSGMGWLMTGYFDVDQRTDESVDEIGNGQDGTSSIYVGGGGGGAGAPGVEFERRTGGDARDGVGAGGDGGNSLVPSGWDVPTHGFTGQVVLTFTYQDDTELTASVRSHTLNSVPTVFDGDDIVIDATVTNLTEGGPAPTGTVEARRESPSGELLASTELVNGQAVVRIEFTTAGGSTEEVVLSYLPSGPEFVAGESVYFTGEEAIVVSPRPVFMIGDPLPAAAVVVSDPVTGAFWINGLPCSSLMTINSGEVDDTFGNVAELRAQYAGIQCDETIVNVDDSYWPVEGTLTWELGDLVDGAVGVSGTPVAITQNIGLLDIGEYGLASVFTSSSPRFASAADDTVVTVSAIETSTSVISLSPSPSTYGQGVGISVKVENESGVTPIDSFWLSRLTEPIPTAENAAAPTGTVTITVTDASGQQFVEDDIPLDNVGSAGEVFSGLSAGEYTVFVQYTPDTSDFVLSEGWSYSEVLAAPTVVTVEADYPYTSYGSEYVTLNATVAVDDFSPCGGEVITACSVDTSAVLAPEGELVLLRGTDDGYVEVARQGVDESGSASFPLGYADAGYYSWKVVFEPATFLVFGPSENLPGEPLSNFESSDAYTSTEVYPAATTITIDSGEGDIVYGDRREVTAAVEWNGLLVTGVLSEALAPATSGDPLFAATPELIPDGVVEFRIDGVTFAVATVENGVASATLPLLNASERQLQVEYRGVEEYSYGSVGGEITPAVPAPMPEGNFLISDASESITIVAAQTAIVATVTDGKLYGEDIAVDITVTNASGTDPVPNGSVTIDGETIELDEAGTASATLDGEWLGVEQFTVSYVPGERGDEEGFVINELAEPNFVPSSAEIDAEVLTPSGEIASGIRQVGDQITAFGSGFTPNGDVQMTLFSDPVDLGIVRADANGDIEFTFSIPAGTPDGMHTLVMTDLQSGAEVRLPIMVTSGLVVTGLDTASVGALGALATLLLGLGGAIVARRGRREVLSLG